MHWSSCHWIYFPLEFSLIWTARTRNNSELTSNNSLDGRFRGTGFLCSWGRGELRRVQHHRCVQTKTFSKHGSCALKWQRKRGTWGGELGWEIKASLYADIILTKAHVYLLSGCLIFCSMSLPSADPRLSLGDTHFPGTWPWVEASEDKAVLAFLLTIFF